MTNSILEFIDSGLPHSEWRSYRWLPILQYRWVRLDTLVPSFYTDHRWRWQ